MNNFNPMNLITSLIKQNPQLGQHWNTAQQMTQGKSPAEIKNIANNLLAQSGMSINEVEQMIWQFMGGKH